LHDVWSCALRTDLLTRSLLFRIYMLPMVKVVIMSHHFCIAVVDSYSQCVCHQGHMLTYCTICIREIQMPCRFIVESFKHRRAYLIGSSLSYFATYRRLSLLLYNTIGARGFVVEAPICQFRLIGHCRQLYLPFQ
jgi:hypothetical protein